MSSQFTQSKALSSFTKLSSSKALILFTSIGPTAFTALFLVFVNTNPPPKLPCLSKRGTLQHLDLAAAIWQSGNDGITLLLLHRLFLLRTGSSDTKPGCYPRYPAGIFQGADLICRLLHALLVKLFPAICRRRVLLDWSVLRNPFCITLSVHRVSLFVGTRVSGTQGNRHVANGAGDCGMSRNIHQAPPERCPKEGDQLLVRKFYFCHTRSRKRVFEGLRMPSSKHQASH